MLSKCTGYYSYVTQQNDGQIRDSRLLRRTKLRSSCCYFEEKLREKDQEVEKCAALQHYVLLCDTWSTLELLIAKYVRMGECHKNWKWLVRILCVSSCTSLAHAFGTYEYSHEMWVPFVWRPTTGCPIVKTKFVLVCNTFRPPYGVTSE